MKRKYFYAPLRNKRGDALITVITVFLVLVIIVVSATMVSHANFKRAMKSSDHASSYYVAETGLQEYYTSVKEYFDTNPNETFDERFVQVFNSIIKSDSDGYKQYSYGSLMNQDASAKVKLSHLGTVDEENHFEIVSIGTLGNETRKATMSFIVSKETVSTSYQPDSILSLDFKNPNASLTLPWNGSDLTGPFISNKPIIVNEPVIKGAVVLNNTLTFKAKVNWGDAVVITSSSVLFDFTYREIALKGIILKPGGSITFKSLNEAKSGNIKHILLPLSAKNRESQYFKLNGQPSKEVFNAVVNNSAIKLFYYNPKNFDPYDNTQYIHHNTSKTSNFKYQDLVGEKPNNNETTPNFKDYFKEDFILDNLDIPSIKDHYIPKVVLPPRPSYQPTYSNGSPYTIEKHGNYQYVDSSNNLRFDLGWFWQNFKEIPLGQKDNEKTGAKSSVRSYNSMVLTGSPITSDPLRLFIGDRDVTIITRKLEMTGNIAVVGTGTLKIYVIGENDVINASSFNMNLSSLVLKNTSSGPNIIEPTRLQIIVYETKPELAAITSANGMTFPFIGTVFSENLNLSSNGAFFGHFVSAKGSSVKFANAGGNADSQLVYAPNAKIELSGGTFKGVIVGRDYSFTSATTHLIFDPDLGKSLNEIITNVIIPGGQEGSSKSDLNSSPIIEVSP